MKKDKMMERFTETQMFNLVKIYKEYDCLWDVSNHLYKNRSARDNAYQEILEKLNIPGLKVSHIPQKIKNVRTSYYQELRKIEASVEEGKAHYQPKVAWFPIADEILRTIPKSQQERYETESEPETNYRTIKKPLPPKTIATLDKIAKYVTPQSTSTRQHTTTTQSQDKKKSVNSDDEYDSFGKYIASSLRSMSKEMSIIAKMELQKTMADIQLKAVRQRNLNIQPIQCSPSTSRACEDPLQDPLEDFSLEPEYTEPDYDDIKIEIEDEH